MTNLFDTLLGNWIVLIVLICVGSGVITSIVKQIRKYGCHRQEVELKRDLVERGLSVDEIERIVAVQSASTKRDSTS
jgi:hypothetical protein